MTTSSVGTPLLPPCCLVGGVLSHDVHSGRLLKGNEITSGFCMFRCDCASTYDHVCSTRCCLISSLAVSRGRSSCLQHCFQRFGFFFTSHSFVLDFFFSFHVFCFCLMLNYILKLKERVGHCLHSDVLVITTSLRTLLRWRQCDS